MTYLIVCVMNIVLRFDIKKSKFVLELILDHPQLAHLVWGKQAPSIWTSSRFYVVHNIYIYIYIYVCVCLCIWIYCVNDLLRYGKLRVTNQELNLWYYDTVGVRTRVRVALTLEEQTHKNYLELCLRQIIIGSSQMVPVNMKAKCRVNNMSAKVKVTISCMDVDMLYVIYKKKKKKKRKWRELALRLYLTIAPMSMWASCCSVDRLTGSHTVMRSVLCMYRTTTQLTTQKYANVHPNASHLHPQIYCTHTDPSKSSCVTMSRSITRSLWAIRGIVRGL